MLCTLGLNYQTAPLAIREKLAFSSQELPSALHTLLTIKGMKEAAILSTCHRTEIYCHTDRPEEALNWLSQRYDIEHTDLSPYLYHFQAQDAVRHLFRVAAGLDSMVLGEAQILGQLKQAARIAQEQGATGSLLNGLFQHTFQIAKVIRTQTNIGSDSVSMAAACLRLAERIFPSIETCRVLFVGAGEMINLCATYLSARHPKSMHIANRTLTHGEALAQKIGAQTILLADLPQYLADYDIVISSTASTLPILGKGMIEAAIRKRRHKPIFMVDLAVPRDIEAEAGELNDVYLYTVDDLASVVENGKENRLLASKTAENMVEIQVDAFSQWLKQRAISPTIRRLQDYADDIRHQELLRAKKRLAKGESIDEVLKLLSEAMMNKYLHAPFTALQQASITEKTEMIEVIQHIYHLHDLD